MARKLKPCGTIAAYRRHRKNDEEPCDQCREANAQVQRERREARRAENEQRFTDAVGEVEDGLESDTGEEVSRLSDLQWQRSLLRQSLAACVAASFVKEIPKLSKELREVNAEIDELRGQEAGEVDPLAEFFNADVIQLHPSTG